MRKGYGGKAALAVAGRMREAVIVTANGLGTAGFAALVEVSTGSEEEMGVGSVSHAEGLARARTAGAALAVFEDGGAEARHTISSGNGKGRSRSGLSLNLTV